VQICSRRDDNEEVHELFRKLSDNVPVFVELEAPTDTPSEAETGRRIAYQLKSLRELNDIDSSIIVTKEAIFPPEKRHLQLRFHPELRARLEFRSWLKAILTQGLLEKSFTDVETPTLFKSTPEGAREFLVPARSSSGGPVAYALSQSPQQYKQVLVASGVARYMQWARCYRDEDSRTDRQPEFTQLDMEWAFAGTSRVMQDVTDIVVKAMTALRPSHSYSDLRGSMIPLLSKLSDDVVVEAQPAHTFTTLTHAECISAYGVDKPDLRIPGRVGQLFFCD
jgi:aspartyl-tRNA synthetase